MEDISDDQLPEQNGASTCANCGNPQIEAGHPTPLCSDCRQSFIKFPIPRIIKIFAFVIVAIMLVSMMRLPQNLSLGIHNSRGEKAFENKQYQTAQNEFKAVLNVVPQHLNAKINRTLASFYNQDFATMIADLGELEGKTIEDRDKYAQLLKVSDQLPNYLPTDSFLAIRKLYGDSAGNVPIDQLKRFISLNPKDEYASIALASYLFDQNEFVMTDSILSSLLQQDPGHLTALGLMSTTKRELNQLNESIQYCDNLLSINKESVYGISSKARTYLKMKRDREALRLALEAKSIDDKDHYNLATLALVYHFNNMTSERDELIARAAKDSLMGTYFEFANNIINKKVNFR